jgi:hypothetical protein
MLRKQARLRPPSETTQRLGMELPRLGAVAANGGKPLAEKKLHKRPRKRGLHACQHRHDYVVTAPRPDAIALGDLGHRGT